MRRLHRGVAHQPCAGRRERAELLARLLVVPAGRAGGDALEAARPPRPQHDLSVFHPPSLAAVLGRLARRGVNVHAAGRGAPGERPDDQAELRGAPLLHRCDRRGPAGPGGLT